MKRDALKQATGLVLHSCYVPTEGMQGVYLVGNKKVRLYKIGLSKNISRRLSGIASGLPFELEIVHAWHVPDHLAVFLESHLHQHFADCWIRGEWFRLTNDQVEESNKLARRFIRAVPRGTKIAKNA